MSDPPPDPETPRCRRCHRPLTDPASLDYRIGPDCREALGIAPRRPVRLGVVRVCGDVTGQLDLLDQGSDQAFSRLCEKGPAHATTTEGDPR